MPPKKLKVDATDWIPNVIYLLHASPGNTISESELYEKTHTQQTMQTESILVEHPSIRISLGNVSFVPFTHIASQRELLNLFQEAFPHGYRKIDVLGLYDFVEADIEELVFSRRLQILDSQTGALVASPINLNKTPLIRHQWETITGLIERKKNPKSEQT